MSAEEDADIDALTSATAAANVTPSKPANEQAPSSPSADTTKSADPAPASAEPAAAAADATPVKEEPRKIGKLNLAAFNAPAESTPEKAPAKAVGKLATNFGAAAAAATSAEKSDDKKEPPRAVGKLGVKMMNIPIFAPGAAPPALAKDKGDASASPVADDASAAAAASAPVAAAASETISESPKAASPAPEPAAAAATESSSASSGPAPSPANKSQPGKLQANPLMANLNSILGGGPRKPAAASAESEEKKEGGEAAASSSSSAAAASSSSSSSSSAPPAEEPAAPITHAKRARVRRRSKTKPSQLQNSDIGAKFEEVKVESAPVAAITVVSTEPKPSPKGSPKHKAASSSASSIPLDSVSSSSSAASAQPSEPQEDPEFAATAALLRQAELDAAKEKLLAATVPVPSVEEANPMDAKAKAALAAMYGDYEEAGFDESKADEYRMLTAAGTNFLKHGKSGKPHERVVFVTANLVLYFMESSKRSKPDPKSSINLALATIPKIKIVKGKTTVNFKRSTAAKVDEDLCLSILGKERELDLQAKTKEERDAWFAALKFLLHLAQEQREKALLESAMGSSY